jgi:hypothetical protein
MLVDPLVGENSCVNLEQRASRLDVFGPTKTFRDSDECRRMVYDYTCLWWGSDNAVYKNNCAGEEREAIDGEMISAAYPPCLNYCTQVANMCANRPDWIRLCDDTRLVCEDATTTGDDAVRVCQEGPTETGSRTSEDPCHRYEVNSFYNSAEGGCGGRGSPVTRVLLGVAGAWAVGLVI